MSLEDMNEIYTFLYLFDIRGFRLLLEDASLKTVGQKETEQFKDWLFKQITSVEDKVNPYKWLLARVVEYVSK